MKTFRMAVGVVLVGLGLWPWAPTLSQPRTVETATVQIRQFAFEPSTVAIPAGGTVRWVNADVVNHQISTGTVVGDRPRPDGRVSSRLIFRGDAFTATFPTPGEYPYYCSVHPFMHGRIVVR